VTHEVSEELAVVVHDDGALRNGDDQVVPPSTVTLLALPVGAVGRNAVWVIAKRQQRSHVAVCHDPDVSTGAAITAVWTTSRDVGLTPERDTPRSATATPSAQLRFINESRHAMSLR
jgi:hypothetical protein